MDKIDRRTAMKLAAAGFGSMNVLTNGSLLAQTTGLPFGNDYPQLESLTTGEWWKAPPSKTANTQGPSMNVRRDEVIAFAVYTHHRNVLKISAQLFPLMPDEEQTVRLEMQRDGQWHFAAEASIYYPGWDAHFRIDDWDNTKDVPYRICHGKSAYFEGLIRRDPKDKNEIVVANMSCNSSRTTGHRSEIVDKLKRQNPDLLFFGGDQTYRHTEHTQGWIEFGLQFRDVLRDRPSICIPDDHDVGHGNVWGESGKQSHIPGDADGGYRYPVEYVNQVQRQQSWHLPDPVDPPPVDRSIQVYFTRLTLGGVDFAILEDRKFKTGPAGKIPEMGPRPDHINDPNYDPKSVDLPGLELLGTRQEKFLESWSQDWTDAEMKCVLSQTAFCGAAHLHGKPTDRLLADLDCNGWPQTPRNRALKLIRKAWAVHLCGDQHLAAVVKHGIDEFGDGPYGFTSPALVNTIYGRWWHPIDEKPGPNPIPNSPLPWTGDYRDGLGNLISMMAYANPEDMADEKKRSDGYGIARFNKRERTIRFECWPRFSDDTKGDQAQFPGWPITVSSEANDGRKVVGFLPELIFEGVIAPVVQVTNDETGEVIYTIRVSGTRFRPRVYQRYKHSVRAGKDRPDGLILTGVMPGEESARDSIKVKFE